MTIKTQKMLIKMFISAAGFLLTGRRLKKLLNSQFIKNQLEIEDDVVNIINQIDNCDLDTLIRMVRKYRTLIVDNIPLD